MMESINVIDPTLMIWSAFFICAILGGLASSFFNNNKIAIMWGWEDGDKKTRYRVGFLADITVGIVAAIAVLWTMTPQTIFQFLGIGAIAGYGGSSILQALVNKLAAESSERDKDKIEKEKKEIEEMKRQLSTKLEDIKKMEQELDTKKAEIQIREIIKSAKVGEKS